MTPSINVNSEMLVHQTPAISTGPCARQPDQGCTFSKRRLHSGTKRVRNNTALVQLRSISSSFFGELEQRSTFSGQCEQIIQSHFIRLAENTAPARFGNAKKICKLCIVE